MARRFEAIFTEQLQDPAFREEWERTAVARAFAIAVIRYRAEHQLSQKQLAERVGWKQSQVGRLELGEHNPAIDTLLHLARTLGLEILIDIQPRNVETRWITPEAVERSVVETLAGSAGGRIVVIAG